jgi:phosphate transport system substrate-binding protein
MKKFIILGLILIILSAEGVDARDEIRVIGSKNVLAMVQKVAEQFHYTRSYPAPKLEITGGGKGFYLFGKGVGFQYPDINVVTRPISQSEIEYCRSNGVTDIAEIVIGMDSAVIANSVDSKQYDFTACQIFNALASYIVKKSRVVTNGTRRWNEIHPSLPDTDIKILGPPMSMTGENNFLQLIFEPGCSSCFPQIITVEKDIRAAVCYSPRKDSAFISGPKNDYDIIGWLKKNPSAFGIVPFSLLKDFKGVISANAIQGILPTMESISEGKYQYSKKIYLYVKTSHVKAIKGLQHFLYDLTAERTIGPSGILEDQGFVPLDDIGRNRARDLALSLKTIRMN